MTYKIQYFLVLLCFGLELKAVLITTNISLVLNLVLGGVVHGIINEAGLPTTGTPRVKLNMDLLPQDVEIK